MKDILGRPGEGIHRATFLGLAWWDLFFTLVAAIVISMTSKTDVITAFIVLFVIGQALHIAFGVETRFLKYIKEVLF